MSHCTLHRGGRILNTPPRTKVVFDIGPCRIASPAMEAANATAQGAYRGLVPQVSQVTGYSPEI
jgi:hypothetical protein